MTITKLKQEILLRISYDVNIIGRIAVATGRSFETVKRWIKNNSDELTLMSVLSTISREISVPVLDLVEELKIKETV